MEHTISTALTTILLLYYVYNRLLAVALLLYSSFSKAFVYVAIDFDGPFHFFQLLTSSSPFEYLSASI